MQEMDQIIGRLNSLEEDEDDKREILLDWTATRVIWQEHHDF